MRTMTNLTTIAAISSPHGSGGIAVVKISGADAISVAAKFFVPYKDGFDKRAGGTAFPGRILRHGSVIDEAVAVLWRAPDSYTGEDTVEIMCHGGLRLTQEVLASAFDAGAVPAAGGEFTKRAFLNGKISLSAAESVVDLINAESTAQMRIAVGSVRGRLTREVEGIIADITAVLAQCYVYIDYPDEDLTDMTREEMIGAFGGAKARIAGLLESYSRVRPVLEGVSCAIVGKPNTGKSSLLNALLCDDRAIVSPYAGTTRDTIEERVQLGDIILRMADTAGIRAAAEAVEEEGIRRSLAKMQSVQLVLALFDQSQPFDQEDEEFLTHLTHANGRKIALLNKCDLPTALSVDGLTGHGFDAILPISAQTGQGIAELTQAVSRLFTAGEVSYDNDAIISSPRQVAAAKKAVDSLAAAIGVLESGGTADVACLDGEDAVAALGELDGRGVREGVLDSIFANFCVGK